MTLREQAIEAIRKSINYSDCRMGPADWEPVASKDAQDAIRQLPYGSFSDEKTSQTEPQVEILIDGEGKYKTVHLHGRTATSWQANLLIEVAKLHSSAWPTGRTSPSGEQIFEMPEISVIMGRSEAIVDAIMAEINRRGWTVPIPSLDELRKDGGDVGFMASGRANDDLTKYRLK